MKFIDKNQFLGLDKFVLGIKRLALGESHNRNFHDHRLSELAIILSSENTIHWAAGQSCPIRRGDVLLLHPGTVHGYENVRNFSLVNLGYDAQSLPLPNLDNSELKLLPFFLACQERRFAPQVPIVHLDEKVLCDVELLLGMLESELNADAPGKDFCAFGLFIAILASLARPGGRNVQVRPISPAVSALSYINLHFCEKMDIAMLAKISCMSPRNFSLRFHEEFGVSPMKYRRIKQLEYAAALLNGTELSLDAIAQRCGFYDTNHFIRFFSRQYGISPGNYRKHITSNK